MVNYWPLYLSEVCRNKYTFLGSDFTTSIFCSSANQSMSASYQCLWVVNDEFSFHVSSPLWDCKITAASLIYSLLLPGSPSEWACYQSYIHDLMLIPSAKHVRTKHHFVPIIFHLDISVIKNYMFWIELWITKRSRSMSTSGGYFAQCWRCIDGRIYNTPMTIQQAYHPQLHFYSKHKIYHASLPQCRRHWNRPVRCCSRQGTERRKHL